MNGILNDDVKIGFVNYRMSDPFWSGVFMGLGTGNVTPTRATTLASLTEAIWTGYLRVSLAGPWTYGVLTPDGQALSAHAAVLFHNTGIIVTPTIYTWFYYRPVSNQMVIAGRFADPWSIVAGGSRALTPFFSVRGE